MTVTAFHTKLYTDHLEEIDFLLAQRESLLRDPEIDWPDIAEFEARLMAHVDGVVLGGEAADAVAIELLESDDEDVIRGTAFALAYSNSPDALTAATKALTECDTELLPAFVGALKHPPNRQIDKFMSYMLAHDRTEVRATAIAILGYRREGPPAPIVAALEDADSNTVKAAINAIRRRRLADAIPQLIAVTDKSEPEVACEAAFALASLGGPRGLDWLRQFCSSALDDCGQAPVYLALTGGVPDCNLIMQSELKGTVAGLDALGIIGETGAVQYLLETLQSESDELRLAAAEALQLITGAGLTEEHTEVEEWDDPDEGLIEIGETTYERVSTSYDEWTSWWSGNYSRMPSGLRWRHGQVFETRLLIEEIADPRARFKRRQQAACELPARQPDSLPFEPDWFIGRQLAAIAKLKE